ncbi:MAG TPA: DUF1592 domain-containing protein [Verrucomicrobiae bacterium]|nr:DUF1592 domain-containing protein [Verrucomicrobiae bacterium]
MKFRTEIRPLLEQYCFDCHGDGENKGNVAFDGFESDAAVLDAKGLWSHALKNLEAGLMPPARKSKPSDAERGQIISWIKDSVFELDPNNPDPGRVTIRRLNRVEYRNTISDLLGVDYNTHEAFPADDTGHGFDNIGDVLTLPPMLLEKYLIAANAIVAKAVPTLGKQIPERSIPGRRFRGGPVAVGEGSLALSFYANAYLSNTISVQHAGDYELVLRLGVQDRYVDDAFDYNRCRLIFTVDGAERWEEEFSWEGGKSFQFEIPVHWKQGEHELGFILEALTPGEPQNRTLSLNIHSVVVRGPKAPEHWVAPANYTRFFPKAVPQSAEDRRTYAQELLGSFAERAYRRPVDASTIERLGNLAEAIYQQPGKTFEAGVAQAMVAVLASPRFLFRVEGADSLKEGDVYPLVDEFSLASRLSYFLWSSMPDEELFRLAREGKLRVELSSQVARMIKDRRFEAFIRNFTGQWLQARDIETVPIDARSVLNRDDGLTRETERQRARFGQLRSKEESQLTAEEKAERDNLRNTLFRSRRTPRAELTGELRRAMRQETEDFFEHIIREDRSLLEVIDSDYTFLNEALARHYGITNVSGSQVRKVALPSGSPRGGIITQGSVLAVTSNPTRTSPVKRGVFILDNILGTPPPPPPPDIPPLEDAAKGDNNRSITLRETLARHREDALCSSCHNRMDPLGLALENFNAMGMWREQEEEQPIDAAGKLITGEEFSDVRELKRILVQNHAKQFYRTITEKLLTYALGRGLEYYDVGTVDLIVEKIEKADGRSSALMTGVIESAAFQKTRLTDSTSHAAAGDESKNQEGHALAAARLERH